MVLEHEYTCAGKVAVWELRDLQHFKEESLVSPLQKGSQREGEIGLKNCSSEEKKIHHFAQQNLRIISTVHFT